MQLEAAAQETVTSAILPSSPASKQANRNLTQIPLSGDVNKIGQM